MKNKSLIILATLCFMNVTLSQKLFRCFYYFEDQFVSYNLKNLYLDDDPKYLTYSFTNDGVKGKIYVNVCDGVNPPDSCNKETSSKSFFSYVSLS